MSLRGKAKVPIQTIKEDAPLQDEKVKKKKPLLRSVSFGSRKKKKEKAASKAAKEAAAKKEKENEKKNEGGKRVHWNHKVEKKRHHRLQDLTPDEKEAVWYTEGDTKIILAMAKVTVKMMMKGEPCDDIDYCSRGLEGKTPAGSKRRQKNKLRVRRAVLEEQEIQRDEGVFDPDYLGEVSFTNSQNNRIESHNVGLNDERNIRGYMNLSNDSSPIPPSRMNRS